MNNFFYILLVACCLQSHGQSQLLTLEDGLSSKNITCILQTRNGILWVGTGNGLNTYDGYTFHEYTKEQGLASSKIKCLFEDQKGLLWIGTWKGLSILNQKTGEIRNYFNEIKNQSENIVNTEITAIAENFDGSILIGLGDGTLLRFKDEKTYTTVFQLPVFEKVYKYQIDVIKVHPDSCIFLLTNYATITKLDKNLKEDTVFSPNFKDVISLEVSKNQKSLCALSIFGDIRYISIETGKETKAVVSKVPDKSDKLAFGYFSDQENIWAGYGEGSLTLTNLKTKTSTDYSKEVKRFITGAPTYIYKDNHGIIWIGTNYGLIKFYPRSVLFENYLFIKEGDYSERNSIRGMIEDSKGDIYIGGYNGLFRINKKDSSTMHYQFKNTALEKPKAYYPYRLLDDSNYIWLTSEIKGFYRFNKLTQDVELPVNTSAFFKAYALLGNDDKSIWVGTQNGLFLYNKENKSLTKHKNNPGSINISNIEVTDLVKDSQGIVWIGSYASGIFKMETDGKVTKYYSESNTHSSLNFVSVLFSENDSTLWAGTRGSGIFKLNTKSGKILSYTKKNGLADNSIAGILKDNSGIFWISTFNGLSKFNSMAEKFENYYDKDGLSDNEFNISASLKTLTGKIYLGGLNGVNGFYPQSLSRAEQQKPKIYLTRFIVYDGIKDSLLERSGDLNDLNTIKFSYKDKFFSFFFSLDDYYDPLRNTFFYKLEGYDYDWTNIGTQNNIRFNSLPAGSYTLKIKGFNSEGTKSINELHIQFSVSRPFYSTWWFYLISFVFTAGIAYSIARYRIYQGLKIRKLRTKISSDLHDEVGSLLTRITIQAELMKQGISQNTTVEEVTKIADTSRMATAAMSDVLWTIDGRNDKVGNLIDRFREQAGEILYPLEMEVELFVRNIDPEKQIDNIIRQNLFLIFKEAIHNIAKHSKATQVTIHLENRVNQFVMTIEDNGKSKPENSKQGQGLRNMKMRAELMEGILEIEKHSGYKVILKIKKL